MNKVFTVKNLYANLQKYFNYKHFQEGQKEIIESVLNGDDVLGILRTGSGKSLCYQLPAVMLPGITVVVSPLISLMIDQVRQVKSFYYKEVVALHSLQSKIERVQTLNQLHHYKLVYVSPELLQQESILSRFKQINVALFVIDEAHCISQWGYDFRPDYLRLANIINILGRPTVLALTGTATNEVQNDIKNKLKCPDMKMHVFPMDRPNISLIVHKITGGEEKKLSILSSLLTTYRQPTIIYFSSRKMTEKIAHLLSRNIPNRKVAYYHGGMENSDRLKIQQQFMNDQLDAVCCTSAFGMGINKKNIRFVIHYHIPTQIESFIQEIGRAGRDGKDSASIVLYRNGDEHVPLQIIKNEIPSEQEIMHVINKLHTLFLEEKKVPEEREEINNLFQIEETKWRFLQYQFETHGMIKLNEILYDEDEWNISLKKIKQFCTLRIQNKFNQFNEMTKWIHSSNCLRKELYKNFQNSIQQRETDCCSNCGFSLKQYEQLGMEEQMDDATNNWQEKLAQKLLIGDKDETGGNY